MSFHGTQLLILLDEVYTLFLISGCHHLIQGKTRFDNINDIVAKDGRKSAFLDVEMHVGP